MTIHITPYLQILLIPYAAPSTHLFMKSLILHLWLTFALLGFSTQLPAQDAAPATSPDPAQAAIDDATAQPKPPTPPADDTRVSILGYHEFSETGPATEMRLERDTFRRQLQAIKDNGLHVISLQDFIDWKSGKKSIPERSILITIDDGWQSVYTIAYPILKEFNYPFTLFLYKNYVDGGGKALTTKMIQEMQANGASIGSHSVTHPYPATVKQKQNAGPEIYETFLQTEMGESKKFLEEKFGGNILTYAYPGGYQTPEMHKIGKSYGYQFLFTVLPGKVKRDSPNELLPRHIILGTHPSSFDQATSFPATLSSAATLSAIPRSTPHPVTPQSGSTIDQRLPVISADLSGIEDLDPKSPTMRVAGFGHVPATFDPKTKKISWKVNRSLRTPTCNVMVSWKTSQPDAAADTKSKTKESTMEWSFIIDRNANYQPRTEPTLPPTNLSNTEPTIENE